MVHALEETHRLLRPAGVLIDIHPVQDAWIEVRTVGQMEFVESDPGYDPDDDVGAADRAVMTVLEGGLFRTDGEREFDFVTYASTVRELRDFFAMAEGYSDGPEDAVARRRDAVYERAEAVLDRTATGVQLQYRERVRISRLKPSGRPPAG